VDATQPHQAFVKLVRAAAVGGALLGVAVLGPLTDLIRNRGLRGFVLVELGLGGIVILGIAARRVAVRAPLERDPARAEEARHP
jgi:hypothetical protein